jgi:hypothetical protein
MQRGGHDLSCPYVNAVAPAGHVQGYRNKSAMYTRGAWAVGSPASLGLRPGARYPNTRPTPV